MKIFFIILLFLTVLYFILMSVMYMRFRSMTLNEENRYGFVVEKEITAIIFAAWVVFTIIGAFKYFSV